MAIKSWSTTAASNVNSLTAVGLGFDENQAPSLLNNAARELMAQVAAFVADAYQGKCPYYAAGGTANAITVTANPAAASYAAGMGFVILAGSTNTGATTINVNGLGTKALQFQGNALKGGEVIANRLFITYYDGTQFQLMTGFVHMVQDTTNKHLGIGSGVLSAGTGGTSEGNIAVGQAAMDALTTGYGSTAIGVDALGAGTTVQGCVAIGNQALCTGTGPGSSVAGGNDALYSATGLGNVGIGRGAGSSISTGTYNVAIGHWGDGPLGTLTTGSYNAFVGNQADGAASSTTSAVAIGANAVAGSEGIAIGRGAVAGANKLALGSATYALSTQTTIGANGAASALTANPVGYLEVVINGTARIIPYYTK